MDEILYLEADEEITSVIDKVKKASADSIGLVIPRNSSLIHSIVNLKLLKKEATKFKKEIALITADKTGRNIAAQIGIPVFEDVHAKRPVNAYPLPAMPKGDEVIEVDMSHDGSEETSDEPPINYYSESAPSRITHNEMSFDKKDKPELKAEELPAVSPLKKQTAAQEGEQPASSNKNPILSNKGPLVFIILFLAIVFGSLLGLPQSTVVVTVAAEPFERSIPLVIDKSATKVGSDHTIPGKLLDITNDDARRIVATGKKDVGTKAKGTVTISNAWDGNDRRLEAGRVLTSAEGKTFVLVNAVVVPGGTATLQEGQLVISPGKVTTDVVATEPGEAYNSKPTRFTISGLSSKEQEKIYAENSKDFTGGQTKQVSVMTQADIDGAKDAIARDLAKAATDALRKQAKDNKLIDEAVTHEITTVETNPAEVETETDYFDIKVKAKHEVMVFNDKLVNQEVEKALSEEVPANKELLLGEGDEFVVSVSETKYTDGKLLLESKVKTKVGTRIDPKVVKEGINGKSQQAIQQKLQTIPNVKDIAVHTFPSWWWQDTSFVPWNTRVRIIYQ